MEKTKKQTRQFVINRHLNRLRRYLYEMGHQNRRFSWLRLVIVIVGGIGTFLAFYFGPVWLGRLTLFLAISAFVTAVYYHRKLDRSILRFQIMEQYTRRQVARMNLDWEQMPPPVVSPNDPEHPFETDLDLTGDRSVHQLINTAVSKGGSQRLASWLLERNIDPNRVLERQALVKEMKPLFGFRNRLTLNSALVSENPNERWDGEKIIAWLDNNTAGKSRLPTLIT